MALNLIDTPVLNAGAASATETVDDAGAIA